jgi:hypothetical protein
MNLERYEREGRFWSNRSEMLAFALIAPVANTIYGELNCSSSTHHLREEILC